MKLQNLRNKYSNHPIIKPLIDYCENEDMAFELVKETRFLSGYGKSYKPIKKYYAILGDSFLITDQQFYFWDDLLSLVSNAYNHLGLNYPENLQKALRLFKKN